MTFVAFDRENFNKCLCGGCPVQRRSGCVREKEEKVAAFSAEIQASGTMPEPPSIIPGIYCSSAVDGSECADLDDRKSCLCPSCPVFLGDGLTSNYYCIRGSAERIG